MKNKIAIFVKTQFNSNERFCYLRNVTNLTFGKILLANTFALNKYTDKLLFNLNKMFIMNE